MTTQGIVINQSNKNQTGKSKQKRNLLSWWKKALNEFEKSGLTAKDFCAQNNLALSSFYKWRKIFKSEEKPSLIQRPNFIPLQLEALDISPQQKTNNDLYWPESFINQEDIPSKNISIQFRNVVLETKAPLPKRISTRIFNSENHDELQFLNTSFSEEKISPLRSPQKPEPEPDPISNIASSGLSLFLGDGLKVSIDKDFHDPTLLRLVQLFAHKRPLTC